jgi:SNF2 family DNA or RNA helicase
MEQERYNQACRMLNGRLIAPYQRDGVQWMLARETVVTGGVKGGFLCDEMGLGKTVQIIATLLGNPKPHTLIIVPKSIVTQWKDEVAKFAPHLRVFTFDGNGRTRNPEDFLKYDITIAPYSVILHSDKVFHSQKVHWSRIILDEGHEIRNRVSKRHIELASIQAPIRWVVSGTPIYNSMKDFVSLCSFIGLQKNYVQAKTAYIRETYIMRRTKEDVTKFNERLRLPPCDFEVVDIEMYPEERDLYNSVFAGSRERIHFLKSTSENFNLHNVEILACLLRVRQLMIHPQVYMDGVGCEELWKHKSKKIETLVDMIETHPAEKTLVFCQFIREMDIIEQSLCGKFDTFRIDGRVMNEARDEQIRCFKKGKAGSVFIIQVKTGGQGLNLQDATRVYIMGPSWNPATELQAIARSHRTGQTRKVTVRKLVCTNDEEIPSVEHAIMTLQQHKAVICAEVLQDPRLVQQMPSRSAVSLADVVNKIFRV